MYLVWVPVETPLLQNKNHQIFTSVLSIFKKFPSSQMRQAGLMNLSLWEEGTQEEESREAFPVLCFNQHGPRVKGKFLIPNTPFRRD